LALFEQTGEKLLLIREQTFASTAYENLESIVSAFVRDEKPGSIQAACFGLAGPVRNGHCKITNLSWSISAENMRHAIGIEQIKLLNDLEAMALGLLRLEPHELVELNPNAQIMPGNKAVLAAGTGFGEAILRWDGHVYEALATEGGHADFAANTPEQDALLVYLRKKYNGHVSYERILSGPGIFNIYSFLRDNGCIEELAELAETLRNEAEAGRWISEFAFARNDKLSLKTLRLFAEIYGAEAGNWALKTLAHGGVLVGGGIAPKILPALQNGDFIQAFVDKGRFSEWMRTLSVKVALNTDTGLLGAAHTAALLLPINRPKRRQNDLGEDR
jgi:glucokinase